MNPRKWVLCTETVLCKYGEGECERESTSVPSSSKNQTGETEGCVVGELIKIDDGEIEWSKAVEVFLAEGRQKQKRVELDLMKWDEIKEEEEKEEAQKTKDDKKIQTEERGETRYKFINLAKEFPNLLTRGSLLPDPPSEIKKYSDCLLYTSPSPRD